MSELDVVIIGGGGSGMCAALEVESAGLRSIILEADNKLGGATALCSGVYYAAGTSIQRANGIVGDTPDAMCEYIMTLNRGAIRPDLIRILADKSADGLEFLIRLGVCFPKDKLMGGGRNMVARGHGSAGEGIAAVLARRVREKPIRLSLNTRVDRLIVEQGVVVGAAAGDLTYRGKAVIVATGGFGNNRMMIDRLLPSIAQHGDRVWAAHEKAPFILGDGIRIAEDIGARITGHDNALPIPTSGFKHSIESEMPPWIMIVNVEGRRFMAETTRYSLSGYLINEQTDSKCFGIFDEKTLIDISRNLDYLDEFKMGIAEPTWTLDSIRAEAKAGRVFCADTLEGLAEAAGISARGLCATVTQYNADFDVGHDGAFHKNGGHHPVRVPPFFAVEIRPSLIGLTAAGLDIDRKGRVLDVDGWVIPGLYGAGETLGCVIGSRYPGGGISIASAIVFGRLVGQSVAEELVSACVGRIKKPEPSQS